MVGIVTESGEAEALAQFAAIARNLSIYEGAAWLALAGALADDSGRRSDVGARQGPLANLGLDGSRSGRARHCRPGRPPCRLLRPPAALRDRHRASDRSAGEKRWRRRPTLRSCSSRSSSPYLAYLPQAVALRRARVVPLWATLVVIGATLVFAVLGSTPISSAVWALGLAVGLTQAARACWPPSLTRWWLPTPSRLSRPRSRVVGR